MSVTGLLLRFAGIYIALTICVAVVFSILRLTPNSGVNSGALIGSVFGACIWFASKNKRYMEPSEKRSAFLGMWAIDMALQILLSLGVGAATGAKLPLGPMVIAIAFIGLLHGAGIYFIVGFAGRQYAKQVTKGV